MDPSERQRKERLFGGILFCALLAFGALLHALGHVMPAEESSSHPAVVESAPDAEPDVPE